MNFFLFIALFVEILTLAECRNDRRGIINANLAEPGQFPFIVALVVENRVCVNRVRDYSNSEIKCTGTLITWNHVLTTAHCVTFDEARKARYCAMGEIDLRAGTIFKNETRNSNAQMRKIERYVYHPNFYPGTSGSDYDIAIITVDKRFKRTKFVSILELTLKPMERNESGIAIGYYGHDNGLSIPRGQLKFDHFRMTGISNNSKVYRVVAVNKTGTCSVTEKGGPLVGHDLKEVYAIRSGSCGGSRFISVFGHRYFLWEQLDQYTQQNAYSRVLSKSTSIRIRLEISLLGIVFASFWIETLSLRF